VARLSFAQGSCLRLAVPFTSALLSGACGLKLDNGAGSGAMDSPDQSTAQNQPGSGAGGTANAPPPEAALSAGRLRGFVLQGSAAYNLEDSSFLQCGFTEQWSVVFEGVAFERLQDEALDSAGTPRTPGSASGEECQLGGCLFALTGSGDLSARGRYGQARIYPRELTITRVTNLERVTRAADLAALNDLSCPQ